MKRAPATRARPRCRSFAPVARADARILILGSMPGAASLAAQQYYAHPRNQFWGILERLCGIGIDLPYDERLERLQQRGLALWDVLASCERRGSLDAAIERRTTIANDIPALLQRICCNGAIAHAALRRSFGALTDAARIEILRLPSTSPANAGCTPARKLAAWRAALTCTIPSAR